MAQIVKGLGSVLFGGGGDSAARRQRETEAAAARRTQEAAQATALQSQGQQAAQLDQSLSRARKAPKGRRLLLDTGDAGKATLG